MAGAVPGKRRVGLLRGGLCLAAAFILALLSRPVAADTPEIRVGTLKFGTVNWELDVIARHGLDREQGIRIERVELAGTPATQVALQAGRVDTIVADWLWVSRQRAAGADWTFTPFSTALGALVVPADSPIRTLADLKGRRLGVAGSPIDKSWLILRLAALREHGIDLDGATQKSFGAPPLLGEQVVAGQLDAVLTYWQFAARLEARGMRQVVSVGDALRALGLPSEMPMIGYVVSERWAAQHEETLEGFLRASRRAKEILAASDEEWTRIAPLTGAADQAELARLRDAFRAGIPRRWRPEDRAAAERLYALLAAIGGETLVGPSAQLAPGTFLDMAVN